VQISLAEIKRLDPFLYARMIQEAGRRAEQRKLIAAIQWAPDPYPGVQTEFCAWGRDSDEPTEALYGGAAAGGKSQCALVLALQYISEPGFAALLLRRTYADLALPGAIMDRLYQWTKGKPGVRWDWKTNTCEFPSGAKIAFGYLRYPGDENRYDGGEYQLIEIDEANQIKWEQQRWLFSRLRRSKRLKDRGVPLRFRIYSNPGGLSGDQIKEHYVDQPPTETRRYFPARAKDNLGLDYDSYVKALGYLDPVSIQQLLLGNWDVDDKAILDMGVIRDCEREGLLAAAVNFRSQYYVGFDVGRTEDLSVIAVGELVGDTLVVREIIVMRKASFAEQKEAFRAIMAKYHPVAARMDKGGIGYQMTEEMEAEFGYVVAGVFMNQPMESRIAKSLQTAFGERTILIPKDHEDGVLRKDLRQPKRLDTRHGMPIVETPKTEIGHADRFWALGLMREALGVIPIQRVAGAPKGIPRR
jgi:hypothetical protein